MSGRESARKKNNDDLLKVKENGVLLHNGNNKSTEIIKENLELIQILASATIKLIDKNGL